jgi:hypothetical protein
LGWAFLADSTSRLPITPQMEQVAAQALQIPARAHRPQHALRDLVSAERRDYAVNNGMVIFPQAASNNPVQQA